MRKLLFILLLALSAHTIARPLPIDIDIDQGIHPQIAYDELKNNGWSIVSWDAELRMFSVKKSGGVNFMYQGSTYNTDLVLDRETYTATNYPSPVLRATARTALSNALNLQFSNYNTFNGYE